MWVQKLFFLFLDIPHILFDYHQECRSGNMKNLSKLKTKVQKYVEKFGFFTKKGSNITREQFGTVRSNCTGKRNWVFTRFFPEKRQKNSWNTKKIIIQFHEFFYRLFGQNECSTDIFGLRSSKLFSEWFGIEWQSFEVWRIISSNVDK